MARILVVDDERAIRSTFKEVLELEDYSVDTAESGENALKLIAKKRYDLVIADISMSGMSGIELFDEVNKTWPNIAFIIVSGFATIQTAVSLVRKGVYEVFEKPIDLNNIITKVRSVLNRSKDVESVRKKVIGKSVTTQQEQVNIIGESLKMVEVKDIIQKVAKCDARVLVIGENGTGKELVAKKLHCDGLRGDHNMIEVNCSAIPSELIESEMFGHEKGSFTGAVRQKKGKFELANGSTLFLDEIGDMSLSAQAKVLRALQERKITPVGGDKDIEVDVRVIAATNKNLREEIAKGNFREDLYHRLSVIVIKVPPLRERSGDIPLLIKHFMTECVAKCNLMESTITPEAVTLLEKQPWTGNVRELSNVIERLLVFSDGVIDEKLVRRFVDIL